MPTYFYNSIILPVKCESRPMILVRNKSSQVAPQELLQEILV